MRASVALLSGSSANAEGLTPMEAAELESVRAALQADLKLVATAKHYCSLAIDSAFQALKEVPCNEGRASAALAALAEVTVKEIERERDAAQVVHGAVLVFFFVVVSFPLFVHDNSCHYDFTCACTKK